MSGFTTLLRRRAKSETRVRDTMREANERRNTAARNA